MNLTKIASIVLLIVAVVLAYFLVSSIRTAIEDEQRIEAVEAAVIEKLVRIRDAQKAYQAVNGEYADSWEKLIQFVDTGSFYIVQRSEEIITLDYGADSVVVHLDTLGTVPVMDSLFSAAKAPNFILADLALIPGSDGQRFSMFTEKITKSGVLVDVIEVVDTAPVNPNRKESNEARNRKPLRFGSRTDVTTAGNWE